MIRFSSKMLVDAADSSIFDRDASSCGRHTARKLVQILNHIAVAALAEPGALDTSGDRSLQRLADPSLLSQAAYFLPIFGRPQVWHRLASQLPLPATAFP